MVLLLFREGKREARMLVALPWDSCLEMGGGISWRALLTRGVWTGLASVSARCIAGTGA